MQPKHYLLHIVYLQSRSLLQKLHFSLFFPIPPFWGCAATFELANMHALSKWRFLSINNTWKRERGKKKTWIFSSPSPIYAALLNPYAAFNLISNGLCRVWLSYYLVLPFSDFFSVPIILSSSSPTAVIDRELGIYVPFLLPCPVLPNPLRPITYLNSTKGTCTCERGGREKHRPEPYPYRSSEKVSPRSLHRPFLVKIQ